MKHINFKSLIVLFLVLFGISPNLWAERWTEKCNIYYYSTDNAGNTHSDGWYNADGLDIKDNDKTIDIGTVTNFTLKKSWAKTQHSDNWGTTNMKWKYGIGTSDNEYKLGESWGWSSDQDRYFNFDTDVNYSVVGNAPNNPGQNTLYVYYILNFNATDGGSRTSKTLYVNFTIPGFSNTTPSETGFSTAAGGEGQSKTISFTQHYGNSLSTSNCSITGTNKSDFSVTSISETGVTVKFQPSTTGTKNATLTITDAHKKTCTITLQGTANDPLSTGVTLRGTFNSWSSSANEFRRATAGATTATTTITFANAKQSERFLVYVDGDKYGNSGTILSSTNSAWGFNKDGADCYFNTACAGTYTFTWDITNKKLSVTYPEETHPSSNYVYFLDDNSWGKVSAHLYDTGDGDKITNWPGQSLCTVTIDGKSYYLCAPGAKQKIVFTNGNNSSLKRLPQDGTTLSPSSGSAKYHNSNAGGTTTTWKDFEFTLTLDANGGDNDGSAHVKWNETTLVSGNTFVAPTREGYKVSKFTINADASSAQMATASGGGTFAANTSYTDGNSQWIYPNSGAKFYAQWTAQEYKVTLDQTDATTAATCQTPAVTYDATLPTINAANKPFRDYYNFAGYWTSNGKTSGEWGSMLISDAPAWQEVANYTEMVNSNLVWKRAENVTVYPKWTPIVYSYTFVQNGGSGATNGTYTYESETITLPVASQMSKTGYTFEGWYTEAEFTNKVTTIPAQSHGNKTFYAKWTPTTTTITVDRQDGSATKEIVATYDGDISTVTGLTDADYQRTGYAFNGMRAGTDKNSSQVIIRSNDAWAFQSNAGSGGTYTNSANPPVWKYTPNTLTLYTRWDANQYTITFNQHEPTTAGDASKQVTFDASVSNISVPAKTGLIFSGYYTEENGAGIEVFTAAGALVANALGYTSNGKWVYANDITLHAYWAAPAEQFVNFGITDGTNLSNTLGTITATVDGVAISSGDKVASGKEVVFDYTAASGTVITTIKGTKLQDWYDGVNISTATSYSITQNKCTLTVSASTVNAYAYALALEYTVSTAVSPVGKGEVTSNNEFRCGPNLNTTLTAVNPDGYDFVKWTADEKGKVQFTGDTTISPIQVAVKEAGRTVTANFKIHNYSITYEGVLDGSEHTNSETYTIESETITFNPATSVFGHKFTGWSPASIATGSTGDKMITAQYGDVTLSAVASANIIEGKQATITPTLTAPPSTYYYQYTCANISTFDVGANGVATFTAPAAGNYTITVNVYEGSDNTGVKLATSNIEITVNEDLSSNWYLAGNGVFGGWGYEQAINMTKKAGESTIDKYYAEIEITTLKDEEFKVLDHSSGKYWANNGAWVNREYQHHNLEQNDRHANMTFKPDMVGTYKFMLDCTEGNHRLTVTFPTSTTYNVDIYYDGVTKTTVEGGAFAKSITANVPQSMQFDHWVVEGETTHVNITDVNSQTTTFTASGTGAVIRAKFNTNKRIYLKGGSNFSDAYMNFYKSNYWNSDLGTGNKGDECVGKNWKMYKVTNTDIFWLDISSAPSEWKNYFSFVNKGDESDNFYMCNVVYRDDMTEALPFYVPRNSYASEHHNSSQYFNEGIWMKYNSTESGYDIRGFGNWEDRSHRFIAETPGGYEFKTKLTLTAGTTYEFKIYNDNGTNYGATNQTMTATSCTNWKMHLNNGNCKITTSEAGEYTFVLNLGSGEVIISVEYPLSASDYRVVAKDGSEVKWEGDLIKHSNEAKKDTTSFFNNNYTFQLQQYNGTSWSDVAGQTITPAATEAKVGVIDFIVTQDGSGNATLAYKGVYTGNYYIRTDGVDGGWGDYKNNSDNKMDNYGSLIVADPAYQYDVYKAKWILSGKNVKFRIANDYSKAISTELLGDDIIGNDKETLPQDANIRFMWNSKTNQLKRAYLSGSTNTQDRYLVLEGDNKMFDHAGNAIPVGTADDHREGLLENELPFADNNNWVYQVDIQAQPGCEVKLTAKYNGKVQYFIGKEGDGDDSRRKIIDGSGTDKYNLRAVYDFKTNRLVAGWIPSGTIKDNIVLGSDMLIERIEQGDASQIVFGGASAASLSISNIQHIYGVLKLTKESMLTATESTFDKCVYWISFPFDVKVSEIFGVEKYGEVWAITKYNGEKRAEKGWFKQDTQTFWEFLKPSDIMKANVGYTLNLDPDYFNKDSSEPWKASATEVAWYFPSIKENIGVVSLAQKDTTLKSMHCTIDRTFDPGDGRTLNHKFTDSNWRVIGVPAFQNLQAPTFDPVPGGDGTEFGLKGFYEWVPSKNTYRVQSASDYTFKATGAYMVQYEGKITWSNAAVITTKAPWHAPEYTYADAKNYSITLEFGDDAYTDQTFVTLIEKASTDFVLNEDMMKIDNAGFPNIYSFAGAYDVAYNETTFDNQSVMLGVSAPKNGSYTFAMPKDFSGKAVLVDLESGEATDLNLSDYTVDLDKGTYNNRFQLVLEVEAKSPTAIDNAKGEWSEDGKTKKLLIRDQIYLINAGRVYNATGAELR